MRKSITVLMTLGIVFGAMPALAFQMSSIRMDCPPSANIAATAQGDWSGETSFVTVSLTDVSLDTRLHCVYEAWSSGVNFTLSQKVPEEHPNCRIDDDRKGFLCRNYRIVGPAPVQPGNDYPYRRPFSYPYPIPLR